MNCSPLGSSVHEIHQARMLEWVAISLLQEVFQPRDWTQLACISGRFFTIWATREAPYIYIYIYIWVRLFELWFCLSICQEWDCWIIWQCYQLFEEPPYCFPWWLHQITFPPAVIREFPFLDNFTSICPNPFLICSFSLKTNDQGERNFIKKISPCYLSWNWLELNYQHSFTIGDIKSPEIKGPHRANELFDMSQKQSGGNLVFQFGQNLMISKYL